MKLRYPTYNRQKPKKRQGFSVEAPAGFVPPGPDPDPEPSEFLFEDHFPTNVGEWTPISYGSTLGWTDVFYHDEAGSLLVAFNTQTDIPFGVVSPVFDVTGVAAVDVSIWYMTDTWVGNPPEVYVVFAEGEDFSVEPVGNMAPTGTWQEFTGIAWNDNNYSLASLYISDTTNEGRVSAVPLLLDDVIVTDDSP